MASCLVIQHVEPESAFAIADSLVDAAVTVDVRRVFAGDPLPVDLSGFDGLVVMGGPMSAGSDEGFASRPAELTLLADALARGRPTLGVCLGAQLLAVAGGGSVSVGAAGPEVGWDTVRLLDSCHTDALFSGLPEALTVLHWHGDTFELPPGSVRLMSNHHYANQAFRLGDAAWGVQFHIEVTAEAVNGFVRAFATEAAGAPGGGMRISRSAPGVLAGLESPRRQVFDRFAALVAARVSEVDLVGRG
jgi:GMP synthase-like glutamine amidotransferase